MQSKTTTNPSPTSKAGDAPPVLGSDELRAAYQVHTLAQMIYGRIAASHAWNAYVPAMTLPSAPYAAWPAATTPWPPAWLAAPPWPY